MFFVHLLGGDSVKCKVVSKSTKNKGDLADLHCMPPSPSYGKRKKPALVMWTPSYVDAKGVTDAYCMADIVQ